MPFGLGFKYTIDRIWGAAMEFGVRKTFTDYIDDVSKTYVDPKSLSSPTAAALANRSSGTDPNITLPGQQRGDPRYTDTYMFLVISVTHKIKTTRGNLPKF